MHAAALRSWGRNLRWSWPRDGRRQTLEGSGVPLMEQYRDQGLNMLWEHAQFEDGSVSVEAGLIGMLDAMRSGRFKSSATSTTFGMSSHCTIAKTG